MTFIRDIENAVILNTPGFLLFRLCLLSFNIQVGSLVVGQHGIFSTPAVSCIIRKRSAQGDNESKMN